jgi:hypothetical protein
MTWGALSAIDSSGYALLVCAETDDAAGRGVRVGVQQRCVGDAEDSCGGADSEGKRHDRRKGESGAFDKLPQCVMKILNQGLHGFTPREVDAVHHGMAGEADGILPILCKMDVERARIAQQSFVNLIGLRKASSAAYEESGENPAASSDIFAFMRIHMV